MLSPDRPTLRRLCGLPGGVSAWGWALLILLIGSFAVPAIAGDAVGMPASASWAGENGRLLDGIFYGVLIGLMIYMLIMSLTFGDPIYLYFILAGVLTLTTLAMLAGDLEYLLGSGPAALAERLTALVPTLWGLFGLLFAWRFLQMRRHVPLIGRITLSLAAVCALAAIAALAGERWLALAAVGAASVAGLVLCPLALRPTRNHGYKITGWYLVAMMVILLTNLALVAFAAGKLPQWFASYKILQWVIIAQAVVDSVGLGQRLPRMQVQHGILHDRATFLAKAAETDPLTGIANRAGLSTRSLALLDPAYKRALLLLDLDNFKPVNDRFGHDVGDEVLVRIARRLSRLAGPRDVVARLGGDEFAILVADIAERDDIALLARRAIDSVAEPIELHGRSHRVGASIGIAQYPNNGEDLSRLMRRADLALYRVKRRGRNGFAFFDELPQNTSSYSNL